MCLLVNSPACEKAGDNKCSQRPKPYRRIHSVDTYERDKDRAARAPKQVGYKEAARRDGGKPGDIAHQVAWEDGQDKGEEVKGDTLVVRSFVPFIDDSRRSEFVDQIPSVASGDGEGKLATQNRAGNYDHQAKTAVDVSGCDHEGMPRNNCHKDLRHQ